MKRLVIVVKGREKILLLDANGLLFANARCVFPFLTCVMLLRH